MSVVRATGVDEVVQLLAAHPGALLVAGGTYVMVDLAEGRCDPDLLVTLRRVEELQGISREAGRVRVGALTTYAELIADGGPLLAETSRAVGSPAQRGSGTVGGGLVGGRAGDLATALLALDATVHTATVDGRHQLPMLGWLQDARPAGELVCAVSFDSGAAGQAYLKAGERQAVISATASSAVVIDGSGGVRIALGGVASTALRAPAAEQFAAEVLAGGQPLEPAAVQRVAALVREGIGWTTAGPRASAEHRRHVCGVLAGRALLRAAGSARVAA